MEFNARDLGELRSVAVEVVRPLMASFVEGMGSPPQVNKGGGDFATAMDVELEQRLRKQLHRHTGIACSGEELGLSAMPADTPQWIIDPIDGTSNYSAGNPQCAMLVSLTVNTDALIGITALPSTGEIVSAYRGSSLYLNEEDYGRRHAHLLKMQQFGFGSIVSPSDSRFPTQLRHHLLGQLITRFPRLRITGSVGVDLAYAALGRFGGAVSFSPHPWDNAAGCVLNQAVGNTVTDLAGQPWRPGAIGMVAALPEIHATIMELIQSMKDHPTPASRS